MGSYVLMKILESAPSRYDKGIRILTLGRLDRVYDRLISHINRDDRVMDMGCGTGTLILKAAEKGAEVKGIDVNPQMLEIAKKRIEDAKIGVELQEMGVAELGSEESGSYDVMMATLCFSELTEDELKYTLKEVKRMLKPGGYLLVADEIIPKSIPKMILNWLIRTPLSLVTYLITQTTTHAVKNLPEKIKEAGLQIETIRLSKMENFIELVARKFEG